MSEINHSQAILVAAISQGGMGRKSALKLLYSNTEWQQKVRKWVLANRGTMEDAEDILHDGVLVLDRNIRQNKYKMEGSIEQYLISICRYLWLNRLRRHKHTLNLEESKLAWSDPENDPELVLINREKKKHLDTLLGKMDDQCLKILTMWKQSYSMKEIANQVGLSNASMAKKYRYRCAQKMLQLLKEDAKLYNALKALK